jgi:L-iditol 2-dehydrogenase
MKVAHFVALKKLEIVDQPAPTVDRPDDVLLRIDRVGVCGSDVHYYLDGRIGNQVLRYPATVGHECSGTVIETGAAVSRVRPGDRVAVDPAFACGTCDQCRAGRPHTCRRLQFMGSPGEALGAVAEYCVVPAENCFAVSDSLTLDDACLVEPLSIGRYAVQVGEIAPSARVAVLGAGPIGLSVLLCAKAAGPCTTYVTDLLEPRLAAARQCGADWTGNARTTDTTAAILQQQPQGLDRVFECSGDPAAIDQAQELLAPGGMLLLVGIPPIDQVSVNIHRMRRKELTFRNVRRQNGCVGSVIEWLAAGRLNAQPLLTHRFPLEKISEAFQLVADYRDGVIKALIDVSMTP